MSFFSKCICIDAIPLFIDANPTGKCCYIKKLHHAHTFHPGYCKRSIPIVHVSTVYASVKYAQKQLLLHFIIYKSKAVA